jgi:hypothetical protein
MVLCSTDSWTLSGESFPRSTKSILRMARPAAPTATFAFLTGTKLPVLTSVSIALGEAERRLLSRYSERALELAAPLGLKPK